MAFVVPTFNLQVNVWHSGHVPPAAPDLVTVGNLTPGRRTLTPAVGHAGGAVLAAPMHLLCPIGTDIRDGKAASGEDLVEVPAGSGRMYTVKFVDDIGSGFLNEHRFAQLAGKGPWPVPFPSGPFPFAVVGGATCATATALVLGVLYKISAPAINTTEWFFYPGSYRYPSAPYTFAYTFTNANDVLSLFGGSCPAPNIIAVFNPAAGGTFLYPPVPFPQTDLILQVAQGNPFVPVGVSWRLSQP